MPPNDSYPGMDKVLDAPASKFVTVTPDDNADLAELPKFILIGATAGTVRCADKHGNIVTLYGAAGQKLKVRPARIYSTSTTASPIIACY